MSTLVSVSGVAITSVPKCKGVIPCGSTILVELLTEQEMANTDIIVKGGTGGPPQGYILAMGKGLFKADGTTDLDFKVGDRVVLGQGSGNFVPKYDDSPRLRILVEVHNINAVVIEG